MFLCSRAFIVFMPKIRPRLLNARNRMVPKKVAYTVSRHTDIGDWWILYMLGRNMDPLIYKEVLTEFSHTVEQRKKAIK